VRALAVAGVLTLVAQELAIAVVLRLANDGGPRGAVTVYNLAWTVFLLPWAVFAVPIATSAFPRLSVHAEGADAAGFAATAARSTRAVLLSMLLAAAVLIAAAEPIARVLAQHGPGATRADVHSLARAVAAFAPGLVGYGLVAHLGRALYAGGRGRVAAAAIVVGWLSVIVADIALVATVARGDAVPALALGNSVGMTVAGALLLLAVTRSQPGVLDGCGRSAWSAAVAAALATVAGRLVSNGFGVTGTPTSIGIGVVVAVVCLLVFVVVVGLIDRETLRDLRPRVARGD
jgi:putative peptidoglycan lipid II flippase